MATIDPKTIYSKSTDKQRIVIAGARSQEVAAMVLFILTEYGREFDYVFQSPANGMTTPSRISNAPMIIIQEGERSSSLLDYQHHIGIIGDIAQSQIEQFSAFADATPKGGIIIYSESEPALSIGKKDRADVQAISFKAYPHQEEGGHTILISSTNEKVPVKISGEQLRSASAAKELLKKVGITSGQFYRAIGRYGN